MKGIGSRIAAYVGTAKCDVREQVTLSLNTLTKKELTVVDLLDRILDKGIVINGDITISIVGVDLLSLKINLVIASLETAKRYGLKLPWEQWEKGRKQLEVKQIKKK